jgi:transcriptional regulator with XRE-family HTH domain
MNSSTSERVKSALEYLKKHGGLTAQQIAQKTKISKPTLALFKSGNSHPRNSTLRKLHKAFPFINHDWLMFGQGNMIIEEKLPSKIELSVMKRVRLHLGLTQRELSDKTGINQGLISHYERTGKSVSMKIYVKLKNAFGDELDNIIGPKQNAGVNSLAMMAAAGSLSNSKDVLGIPFTDHVVCTVDAMEPDIQHGDILLLKNLSKDSVLPLGEIYYLEFKELNLLRIVENVLGSKLVLKSLNPKYGVLTVHKTAIEKINLVVGRVQRFA